jgi:ubiquinone/menaquinone biosynthesis C-methylase UbiE
VDALGIDLSPGMIEAARREHPGLRFDVGSMTDLALAGASMAGLVAWYSLIHVADDEISRVFAHFQRVLRPSGTFAVAHAVNRTWNKWHGFLTVESEGCFQTARWHGPSCCGTALTRPG